MRSLKVCIWLEKISKWREKIDMRMCGCANVRMNWGEGDGEDGGGGFSGGLISFYA